MPLPHRAAARWLLPALTVAACQGSPPPTEPTKARATTKASPTRTVPGERSAILTGLVSGPKTGLISDKGAGVISNNGASAVGGVGAGANPGGALRLLGFGLAQAGQTEPVAGAAVGVFDLAGRRLTGADVTTDGQGRYATPKFLAPPGALVVVARYEAEGRAIELAALAAPPSGSETGAAAVSPASTLVAKKTRQLVAGGALDAEALDVAAASRVAEALEPALDAEAVVAAAILADAQAAAVFDDATQEGTAGPAVAAAVAGTTAAAIAVPAPTRTPRPPAIEPGAPLIFRLSSVPAAGAFVTTLEGRGFGPTLGQVHVTFPGAKLPVPYTPTSWSDTRVAFNHAAFPDDGTAYVDVVLPDGGPASQAVPGRHSNVVAFRAGGAAAPVEAPTWLAGGPAILRTAPDGARGLTIVGYGFGTERAVVVERRAGLGIAGLPAATWADRRIGLATTPAAPSVLQILLTNGMRSNAVLVAP